LVVAIEHDRRDGPVPVEVVGEQLRLSSELAEQLCSRLVEMDLLCRTDEPGGDQYLPACRPSHVAVGDVLQVGQRYGPLTHPHDFADEIRSRIENVRARIDEDIDGLTIQAVIDR
ncbi:MAG: hypothetical protein KGY81_00710, partial [Phycisphaerae bacterium]|nr:hypothetical protein [Phycisphaerae bacterium]